jgi:hypothetical protein
MRQVSDIVHSLELLTDCALRGNKMQVGRTETVQELRTWGLDTVHTGARMAATTIQRGEALCANRELTRSEAPADC